MNTVEQGWEEFKKAHPDMMDETLGEQVSKVFKTIQKSGILGRFGVNASAIQNFEILIEQFTEKAYTRGWNDSKTNKVEEVIK